MTMQRAPKPPDERSGRPMAAKKSLGQHFLTDRAVVSRIIEAIGNAPVVVEVGPGHGVLTGPLASTGRTLVCVELDDTLAAQLQEHFATTPGVTVVHSDVLA